jgi:hypothetical protein
MATSPEERIVENNRLFREANEHIRSRSSEFDDPVEQIPFLCECSEEGCATIVRLTSDEYQSIRDDPEMFFTADGHEDAEAPVGHVVARNDGYVVVKKETRQ